MTTMYLVDNPENQLFSDILLCPTCESLSTPIQSTTWNRKCWKDSSQLIMTGHHESPASVTWLVPHDRCLTWPENDICIILQLHPPFLCKGCQIQPLLLWFPAPILPVLLPQLAPYASHTEKCHSSLALLATASLLGCCLSRSLLLPHYFLSFSYFAISFYFTLFPCLCLSIGIIIYMAIKRKVLALKTWINRARQWSEEDITSCNHCCCGCWCKGGAGYKIRAG